MSYQATFWGARGSVPTPGASTARYGGNTSCVGLSNGQTGGPLVVLDAGTGIRPLGHTLLGQSAEEPVTVDLVITHTHWDHIQGLPFFTPLFAQGNTVRIWGAKQGDVSLETILRYQMNPVVFPVPLDQLSAQISVTHVTPGEFEVDGYRVRTMALRHPGDTLGFVFTPADGGSSLAYIPDNELSGGEYPVAAGWHRDFRVFLEGVHTLVHDAMYSPEELRHFSGWGHSSSTEAVQLAAETGAKRVVLFHHRPEHDDGTIDAILDEARETAIGLGADLEVIAAQEGKAVTL